MSDQICTPGTSLRDLRGRAKFYAVKIGPGRVELAFRYRDEVQPRVGEMVLLEGDPADEPTTGVEVGTCVEALSQNAVYYDNTRDWLIAAGRAGTAVRREMRDEKKGRKGDVWGICRAKAIIRIATDDDRAQVVQKDAADDAAYDFVLYLARQMGQCAFEVLSVMSADSFRSTGIRDHVYDARWQFDGRRLTVYVADRPGTPQLPWDPIVPYIWSRYGRRRVWFMRI